MKSEEIKAQIKEKESQIEVIQNEIRSLYFKLKDAVTAECGVKIGEMAKVVNRDGTVEGVGIFGGFNIRFGDVEPIVYKLKKDGTPSKNVFWTSYRKIEKA